MVRRNHQSRAAQERAARLADRRELEEGYFAAAAAALAVIDQTVGSLDLAVELANTTLAEAGDDLVTAVRSLCDLGYRAADVAAVLGVDSVDLRPGLTLALRRSRQRRAKPAEPPTSGSTPSEITSAPSADTTGPAGVAQDSPVGPATPVVEPVSPGPHQATNGARR